MQSSSSSPFSKRNFPPQTPSQFQSIIPSNPEPPPPPPSNHSQLLGTLASLKFEWCPRAPAWLSSSERFLAVTATTAVLCSSSSAIGIFKFVFLKCAHDAPHSTPPPNPLVLFAANFSFSLQIRRRDARRRCAARTSGFILHFPAFFWSFLGLASVCARSNFAGIPHHRRNGS